MVLSIKNGLTCPIANPEKITVAVRAADLVLGRDDFAMRFIECSQNKLCLSLRLRADGNQPSTPLKGRNFPYVFSKKRSYW